MKKDLHFMPVDQTNSRGPEAAIRQACEAGNHEEAVEIALRAYGAEILGYLAGRMRDEEHAREVYSTFSIELWRGFASFQWRCSARAWAYTVARNAANKAWRTEARRREVPFSRAGDPAWRPGTRTPTFQRTPIVREVNALRERLSSAEQELLTLRIDRRMTWPELAVVLAGEELDEAGKRRESAKLRQRFVATKRRLRTLAKEAGIVP